MISKHGSSSNKAPHGCGHCKDLYTRRLSQGLVEGAATGTVRIFGLRDKTTCHLDCGFLDGDQKLCATDDIFADAFDLHGG